MTRRLVAMLIVALTLGALVPAVAVSAAAGAGTSAGVQVNAGPSVKAASFEGDIRGAKPVAPRKVPTRVLSAPHTTKAAPPPSSRPMAPNAGAPVATTAMPSTNVSFNGLDLNTWGAGWPPDTVGDVGPNHYVQAVNSSIGIYSKTGTQLAAFTFNTLWSGAGTGTACDTSHMGDPTVVYDPMADRFIVGDFAFASFGIPPFYECVAVSKTSDPVSGGWWLYAIRTDDVAHPWFADYPKMGIWPDGLYMTANMFDSSDVFKEVRIWAFNRADLESGAPLRQVIVDLGSTAYMSLLPSNLRGALPPAGRDNILVSESQTLFAFEMWKFHVDYSGAGSTFTGPTSVSQTAYTVAPATVTSPGNSLDSLRERLMMQAQYVNLAGSESVWVNHTVRTSTTGPAGIQWAQLNVTGGVIAATPVQQQIYGDLAADGVHRWLGSLAVDKQGNMALGYSASRNTVAPDIRYNGRLAGDPVNTLPQGEASMLAGVTRASQTGSCSGTCTRWGDYSAMSLDPDGCTFWYTNEYYAVNGLNWQTRIGSFTFPGCVPAAPIADVSVTKADSPDPVTADSNLTYTLNVHNNGPGAATNVTVLDTLPASVIRGTVDSTQGSCSGTTTVSCNLGTIANGGNATVTIRVVPVQPGTLSNTASVSATESDPTPGNNSSTQATTVKAQAKTKYVRVTNSGFSPVNLSITQGMTVQWNMLGPSANGVQDGNGLGFFNVPAHSPVHYTRFTFVAAGAYTVTDKLGHSSTVFVALKKKPGTGTTATPFTVTWASASAPAGYAFDIEIARPGGAFVPWLTGQTAKSAVFTPDAGTGTYKFRAKMRLISSGATSGFSKVLSIVVS